MKLIDEKGKLFGKINIIDLIILIVLVSIILFGINYFLANREISTNIYFKLSICEDDKGRPKNCGDVPEYYFDFIDENSKILSSDGSKVVGEIYNKSVKKNNKKDVEIIIKLDVVRKRGGIFFGDTLLKVGNSLTLNIKKLLFVGLILDYNEDLSSLYPKTTNKVVKIKLKSKPNFLAEEINIGDEELDFNNKIIAKVLSKEVYNAEKEVITEDGQVLLKESPLYKDIELEILLEVEEDNNYFYFLEQNLAVGNEINLNPGKVNFQGTIIEIHDLP